MQIYVAFGFLFQLGLVLMMDFTVSCKAESCVVRMTGGKMARYGDCDKSRETNNKIIGASKKMTQAEQLRARPPCESTTSMRGCFWLFASNKLTYWDGAKKCEERASTIAVIRNSTDFDEATSLLRTKMNQLGMDLFTAWISGTINTTIDQDQYKESGSSSKRDYLTQVNKNAMPFLKWLDFSTNPAPREGNDLTHVNLYVEGANKNVMINESPDASEYGVVCFYH